MKTCDVLLCYELKKREIENLCLIKHELEGRGLSVELCEQYESFFRVPEPINAGIVVVPAYYRMRARFYSSAHVVEAKKILNMQWEQIFSNGNEVNGDAVNLIKPWGRDAVHIAWGEKMRERLRDECGIPEDHIAVTGHVALDFLRDRLRNYYDDRQTLFSRYGVPTDRTVHLFVSSFSLVMMHDKVLSGYAADGKLDNILEFRRISIESQRIILEWFDRILEHTNDIIIYRPHPEEKNHPLLLALQDRHKNFYIIGDESIRQWVLTCDKIYSWFSSAAAEIYAAGKGMSILRPVNIPYEQDVAIYNHASFIQTYDKFEQSFISSEQTFAIPEEEFDDYYTIPADCMSYQLVCDIIQKALSDDLYNLAEPLKNPFGRSIFNTERVKNLIKRLIVRSNLCKCIHNSNFLKGSSFRTLLDDVYYVNEKLAANHVSNDELEQIEDRIKKVLGK